MTLLDSFRRTEVDGVRVVWTPTSHPPTASLVFRVGRADETFLAGGVTHLVEHLVMRGVGRMPIEVNAHVSTHTTEFVATGSGPQVAEFLDRVCRQLSALETSALEVERKVLGAEAEGSGCGPAGEAASLRYGCRGAGLLPYRDLGVARLTAAELEAWAARSFTRDNVVLGVAGDLPADLRLPLPSGERRGIPPVTARPLRLPAWEPDSGGTAVSLPVPSAAGMDLALARLAARAVEDVVRHRDGLAYTVDSDGVRVSPDVSEVAVLADNDPGDAVTVVEHMLDVLERFAEHGPGDDELRADAEESFEALADPRHLGDALSAAAAQVLLGLEPETPAQVHAATLARTREEVRDATAAALGQALVLLPEDQGLERPGFERLAASTRAVPDGRQLRPRMLRGVPRGVRLVHGEEGVALRLPDGDLVVHWEDVVGVTVTEAGDHVLQSVDGPALPVVLRDFRGADDVVAAARRRLPAELFVPEPDADRAEMLS